MAAGYTSRRNRGCFGLVAAIPWLQKMGLHGFDQYCGVKVPKAVGGAAFSPRFALQSSQSVCKLCE